MANERERHEAKTQVISFRVRQEDYERLEKVKIETGLSNTDLVMLGAGIAQEEKKSKLAEVTGLENRLAALREAISQTQQELDKVVAEERKRRLAELDKEMEAFKLFDRLWNVEQVSIQLDVPYRTALHYFESWVKERQDKEALEKELLRLCLKQHISRLKDQRMFGVLRPEKERKNIEREIDYCQSLLETPGNISAQWKRFLLAEYSDRVQLRKTIIERHGQ
jgi:hypothetical protein